MAHVAVAPRAVVVRLAVEVPHVVEVSLVEAVAAVARLVVDEVDLVAEAVEVLAVDEVDLVAVVVVDPGVEVHRVVDLEVEAAEEDNRFLVSTDNRCSPKQSEW